MNDVKLLSIRAKADSLGISYHHRAGIAKIQELIDAHLANTTFKSEEVTTENLMERVVELEAPAFEPPEAAIPFQKRRQMANRKKVSALVRCRIQCMNPSKKDWEGEFISVGSARLGTFKKFVPFGLSEPYHLPKIIYDMLMERKCSIFYNTTDHRGHKTRKARQISEYAIEVMTPLTREELDELAIKQAMARGKVA